MARLNITVPDVLYARLEQLRDRINLSKVCATALEKEVMMLEGQPAITDPRIARLLQRLQSARERWHQRGYDDGFQWAVELATRDELQSVATYLADLNGQHLVALFNKMQGHHAGMASMPDAPGFSQHGGAAHTAPAFQPPPFPPMPAMPPGPEVGGNVSYRVFDKPHTVRAMGPGPHTVFYQHGGQPFPAFPESFRPDERLQYWQKQDQEMSGQAAEGEATRVEVDATAYMEGWRDAVKGIWQTISPALS
jgi:hypothetical protein